MSLREGRAASLGTIVVAALVPKCPLCVAAMLSALGVGSAAAGAIAPAVRPFVFTLAALAVVLLARLEWRRLRGARKPKLTIAPCCGAHRG